MRICVVGHFKDNLDEGVRLVARNIALRLQETGHLVQCLDFSSMTLACSLRRFRPEIVHYVISPTTLGLLMSKATSLSVRDAKTVISAVHPSILSFGLVGLLKPDLILAQAEDSEEKFASLGFKTEFLPNGVDTDKFRPLSPEVKFESRERYKIAPDKYVVLHLASLKKERNLGVFARIQRVEGIQVVIIGREGERADSAVRKPLKDAGCIVLEQHLSDVENVFNMADCYVFPTTDRKACIETPLSVLEAIACGLPVVTTRFGALPRVIGDMRGVFFADNEEEMLQEIDMLRTAKTRYSGEDAKTISWNVVTERLLTIYQAIAVSKPTSR